MLQHSLAVLCSGAAARDGCHNLWVMHAHREEDKEVIKTCRTYRNPKMVIPLLLTPSFRRQHPTLGLQ